MDIATDWTPGVGAVIGVPVAAASVGLTAVGVNTAKNGLNNMLNSDGKKTSDGNPRQKSETKLEEAQNQLEGIEAAQEAAKKQAPPCQKQTKLNETQKSKQNLKTELKRIDNLEDAQE